MDILRTVCYGVAMNTNREDVLSKLTYQSTMYIRIGDGETLIHRPDGVTGSGPTDIEFAEYLYAMCAEERWHYVQLGRTGDVYVILHGETDSFKFIEDEIPFPVW